MFNNIINMVVDKYACLMQIYVYHYCNNPKWWQILCRIFSISVVHLSKDHHLKSSVCSDWSALTCLSRLCPTCVCLSSPGVFATCWQYVSGRSECIVVTSQCYRSPNPSFEGTVSDSRVCEFFCGVILSHYLFSTKTYFKIKEKWKSHFLQCGTFKCRISRSGCIGIQNRSSCWKKKILVLAQCRNEYFTQ